MNKFCTGCQQYRKEENGKRVKRGKITRWICHICIAKTNVSPYTKEKKDDRG